MESSEDVDKYLIEEVEKRPKLYNGYQFKKHSDERINLFKEIAVVLQNKLGFQGKNKCQFCHRNCMCSK